MTKIECSKCGDMIEVTATSLLLPFVCIKCDEVENAFIEEAEKAEVTMFYDAIQPKSTQTCPCGNGIDDNGDGDCAACANQPKSAQLTEEFSSVENTTILIEDLEKQLSSAQARSDYFEEMLGHLRADLDREYAQQRSLSQRNDNQCATINAYQRQIAQLQDEKNRQEQTIVELKDEVDVDSQVIALSTMIRKKALEERDSERLVVGLYRSTVEAVSADNAKLCKELDDADNEKFATITDLYNMISDEKKVPWYRRLWEQVCDRLPR